MGRHSLSTVCATRRGGEEKQIIKIIGKNCFNFFHIISSVKKSSSALRKFLAVSFWNFPKYLTREKYDTNTLFFSLYIPGVYECEKVFPHKNNFHVFFLFRERRQKNLRKSFKNEKNRCCVYRPYDAHTFTKKIQLFHYFHSKHTSGSYG